MYLIDIEINNWKTVEEYCLDLNQFDFVDFNVLYKDSDFFQFLEKHKNNFILQENERFAKQYFTGKYCRFFLDIQFINFLKEFKLQNFKNYFLEDPSFIKNDKEIISIVSHEDVLIVNDEFIDISFFYANGFENISQFQGFYN